jgi:hypothetical protein
MQQQDLDQSLHLQRLSMCAQQNHLHNTQNRSAQQAWRHICDSKQKGLPRVWAIDRTAFACTCCANRCKSPLTALT